MNKREEMIAWILKCVKADGSTGVFYRKSDYMMQDIITATRIHRLKALVTYGKGTIIGTNSWHVTYKSS